MCLTLSLGDPPTSIYLAALVAMVIQAVWEGQVRFTARVYFRYDSASKAHRLRSERDYENSGSLGRDSVNGNRASEGRKCHFAIQVPRCSALEAR